LEDPTRTLAEFADTIAELPLTATPGEKWDYNNLGYDVLGRIIEVASGRSLDRYLYEEIFAPIGMRETSFHVMPRMEGRIPVVYSHVKDGTLRPDAEFLEPTYLPTTRFLSCGGGLLSTPADYLRFAQMLLNGGKLDGKQVLSNASVATMMRNHLSPSLTPIVTPVFNHAGYGFGLGGAVLVDSMLSGEPGSAGIYRWAGSVQTFFWIDPKRELIGMLFTQSRTGGYKMERAFQQLVYAAVLP
jgi:CubicO group peptidase (beta-lactamase class C family)